MNTPNQEDHYLRYLTYRGCIERYNTDVNESWRLGTPTIFEDNEIVKRIEHELDTICKAGFAGYFLVVADILRYCREARIPTGPGRGSICGSAVAYAVGITDVEPMRFGIPFERFLHLERIAQPDIDLDICQSRRQEVIEYLRRTYGEESVAQIITFTPLNAKGVVRDVCRVLHVDDILRGVKSNETGDKLALMIPEGSGADQVKLSEFIESDQGKEFKSQIEKLSIPFEGDDISILDTCYTLEGLRRHGSVHAAGVVIADRPLIELAPLYKKNKDADIQIQFDMRDAEDAGLLKMDILGLRTVTVMGEAERLIQSFIPEFNLKQVPLDDEATFKLLQGGDTVGVFQLEGDGITNACIGMQPDRFEDIIALIALYRPGPMEQLGSYFARKKGEEVVEYAHPAIQPILERTYGLMVYQEQVMGIVRELGGYTAGEADQFRKAIGKKLVPLIQEKIDEFAQRAVGRGHNADVIRKLGEQIFFFGRYGFNLGHATGYAFITYWTAYLKANFPAEFYTANLNSYIGTTDKIGTVLRDAEKHGIRVLPPDINTSGLGFTLIDGGIRFGLSAVKGLGDSAVTDIVEERDATEKSKYESVRVVRFKDDGTEYKTNIKMASRTTNEPKKFDSFWDFCKRLSHITITAKKALISAGAFDSLTESRGLLFVNAEDINGAAKKNKLATNLSEFGPSEIELMRAEKEVLGFYITSHPLAYYKKDLLRYGATIDGHFEHLDTRATIGGIVVAIRLHAAKNGEMAWVTIESGIEEMPDVTIFASVWADVADIVKKDEVIVVDGRKEYNVRYGWSFKADTVRVVDRARPSADALTIIIQDMGIDEVAYLNDLHSQEHGVPTNVVVKDKMSGRLALISTGVLLNPVGALIESLESDGYVVNIGNNLGPNLMASDSQYDFVNGSRVAIWDLPFIKKCCSVLNGNVVTELRKT